jgi:hypothetical protein
MTRERMATTSFSAGERRLPGVRAALALGLALALASACGTAAAVSSAPATPTAIPEANGVPMLGTRPPAGLVLPSYFVAVTASRDGSLTVLTAPASRCVLVVRRPSGETVSVGERIAGPDGYATFTYAPSTERGESIQTATCALGDRVDTTGAKVVLP